MISACPLGSWPATTQLCPLPMMLPSLSTTTAPTGTSPAWRAFAASTSASRMKCASRERSIRESRTSFSRLKAWCFLFCRISSRKASTAEVSSESGNCAICSLDEEADTSKRFLGVSDIQFPASAKNFFASSSCGCKGSRAVALNASTTVRRWSGDFERVVREEPRRIDNFTKFEIRSVCWGILSLEI